MSTIATKPLPGTSIDPLYPESDGEPMGETEYHVLAIIHLFSALTRFYRDRDDVYVAADMFLYYEQGNPKACKAPDVMVVAGVASKHARRSFRIWEEGVAPTVIFEVTSSKTRDEDEVAKPRAYATIGVKEYFVFDPECAGSEPALAGYRLQGGVYRPVPFDAAGLLTSLELRLAFEPESPLLRVIDLQTGKRLPSDSELYDQNTELTAQYDDVRHELDAERE
ncbi:MAG TPA: Uma2 family endonuclease, partial [Planctomycetaceae bacterium]